MNIPREIAELCDGCGIALQYSSFWGEDKQVGEATHPDDAQRDSDEGRRWLGMVQRALEVRRKMIAPRHHLLSHGSHTSHRIGDTGIQACWRYDDGQAIVLQLNLGATPLPVHEPMMEITEPLTMFSHAWPEGAPAGSWPAWSARWLIGKQA